jgi:hypothetical protein
MKRYLIGVLALTVVFALLPTSDATAQLKWEGGVKGGLSMANFYGDDIDNTSLKIGAAGGAFVTAHVTEMFGVRLEGLYVQKGAKYDSAGVTADWKFDYIEIPLLGVASFAAAEKMMINVFAGPALGILVSAKVEDLDVKDNMKSMDFGVTGGAGFTYAMEAFTILLEGRFTLGLMSIDDTEAEANVKNMNFAVMGGFAIPFGGAAE